MFHSADKDGNGVLTFNEAYDLLHRMNIKMDKAEAEKIFKKVGLSISKRFCNLSVILVLLGSRNGARTRHVGQSDCPSLQSACHICRLPVKGAFALGKKS